MTFVGETHFYYIDDICDGIYFTMRIDFVTLQLLIQKMNKIGLELNKASVLIVKLVEKKHSEPFLWTD